MKKLNTYFLAILLFFQSCSNDIKTEKDKYPDIPEFPKFKNDKIKLVEVENIELKLDSTVQHQKDNYIRTRYFVKDSTLYLITFFADSDEPENFMNSDREYTIDLVVVENNKIQHTQWTDNDFKLNFKIDSNNDLTIGKHKFQAKYNYRKQETISNFKEEYGNDTIFSTYIGYKLSGYFTPTPFDQIVVNSERKLTGTQNSPILIPENKPLFLTYYELKFKNKIGHTKLNNKDIPKFIKLNNDLYFIEQENKTIDDKNKVLKIKIYKLE